MSIFDGHIEKSEATVRFESLVEKAPNQKQGEENRCLSVFQDLWGEGELVDIPDTSYRTVANPISREVTEELLELLGTEGVKIFSSHSKWQDGIMIINPEWKKLVPPYELNYNEDGTVTLKP